MKTLRTLVVGLAAFTLLAFSPSPVSATLYNFSYAGDGVSASGTLTTTGPLQPLTGPGLTGLSGYLITAITGTRNGVTITGIESNPNFPGVSVDSTGTVYFDNALIVTTYGVDVCGLNYYAGGTTYNLSTLLSPNLGGNLDTVLPYSGVSTLVTLTITPVPEPTTMIAGALLLLPFGASTVRVLRKNRTV